MKYLFMLLAFGTLACGMYAAPSYSEIQQDGIDSTDDKEFLDLINRIAKTSQNNEEGDSQAEAQFWGSILSFLKKPLMSLAGKAIGGLMNRRRGNGVEEHALIQAVLNKNLESIAEEQQQDDYQGEEDIAKAESEALVQAFVKKLMSRDSDVMAAIESLPEEARAQLLFSVGVPLLGSLLGGLFSKKG